MALKALSRDISTDERSTRAHVIQMLYESLDEVEEPGGKWHKSIAT